MPANGAKIKVFNCFALDLRLTQKSVVGQIYF